jgi:hypothetical protein
VAYLLIRLWDLTVLLKPFLPDAFEKIKKSTHEYILPGPLFVRK